MFRRERPQKGRYRQFFQIGAEAIGSESPAVDAEVIEMVVEILERAGPERIQAADQFGGRSQLPAAVCRKACARNSKPCRSQLCGDCQRRADTNPLRVLDCKVEADQPIIDQPAHHPRHLCDACRAHFAAVQAVSRRSRHRLRSPAAPGARAGLLHAHHVRSGARRAGRAEFGARRRPLRRAGGIAGLESARAGHRLFDRRRPAGDERGRRADAGPARPVHRAAGRSGSAARRHAGARSAPRRPLRRSGAKAS